MALTLALNNALSGLQVSQQALATVSNNIANANTEGYSRQIVDQSAVVINYVGNGAQIDDVTRKVDRYLERTIMTETSNVAYDELIDDYYDRMQVLMGEPGEENSIDEYVENYFDALQNLAETPNFASYQSNAVKAGEILAFELSTLARNLEDLRFQADQDISAAVDVVNAELEHLEDINVALNQAGALGLSNPTLLDERDIALENIAEYMDISVSEMEFGRVAVSTRSGLALLNEGENQLSYTPLLGADNFINNEELNALELNILNARGEITGSQDVFTTGIESSVESNLYSGRMEALHVLRDQIIPDILAQLDQVASRLRDEVNAIHNDGAGYPPADTMTGTREFRADDAYDWSGEVTIAVVNDDGTPARSVYDDESYTGFRPLTLNLEELNDGNNDGHVTMQTIIDEINNHFNAPPTKAVVNNLNNIQMVSNTDRMPSSATPMMDVDFDLENISDSDADFWVSSVTILDDVGADISASTDTVPRIPVNALGGYTFVAGDPGVRINTDSPHNLQVGDIVFMEDPGLPALVAGGTTSSAGLVGYVEITEIIDDDTFVFNMGVNAGAGATEGYGAFDALPPWDTVAPGDKDRTKDAGLYSLDFTGNVGSQFYDVSFSVGVYDNDGSGQVDIATVTYRIDNYTSDLLNDRYDVQNVTGTGDLVFPDSPHQYIIAQMVDEDGNPLSVTNGNYGNQPGYLQLVANSIDEEVDDFRIVIDELNSQQLGVQTEDPIEQGTDRGFSHYFELNNFFVSNEPTTTGDTTSNSAINMAVEQRLLDDPSLIATGDLQLSNQPADPNDPPLYTYERFESDNSVAQRLASLAYDNVEFDAAGGLPDSDMTFNNYTSELLGYQATQATLAENKYIDSESLLAGFVERVDQFSGVNLDEELANTILYQNAYTASARVITVTDELFEALLGAF